MSSAGTNKDRSAEGNGFLDANKTASAVMKANMPQG
jgi:hypothetical protein